MATENQSTQFPGSQLGNQNSDSGAETVTMTKAELNMIIEGRLKGSGKELKKARDMIALHEKEKSERAAADENARRKKLEEDGQKDELLRLERDEKSKLSDEINQLKERELARVEKIDQKNKDRIGKLPKDLKDLVPVQLSADDLSDYLDRLESKIVDRRIPVAGFGGVRMNGAPIDPLERAKQVGHDFLFGRKKGNH
jgi:hypothetical protein